MNDEQLPKYAPIIWTVCAVSSTTLVIADVLLHPEDGWLIAAHALVAALQWWAAIGFIRQYLNKDTHSDEGEQE